MQLQVYATLIFYGVLVQVCRQLATVLQQPLEKDISGDGLQRVVLLQHGHPEGRNPIAGNLPGGQCQAIGPCQDGKKTA